MNAHRLHSDEAIWQWARAHLGEEDVTQLQQVRLAMPIAADVARSDLFLQILDETGRIAVATHAQPHSTSSLYQESPVGRTYDSSERWWMAARASRRRFRVHMEVSLNAQEVGQQVWPILGAGRRPVAALVLYTNAIERERHRRRDPAFRRSLEHFLQMTAAGEVRGAESLPPFLAQDGILFVDHTACYRYLSGQANNLYRQLGYLDDLRGRTLDEVAAGDLELVRLAWERQTCVSSEDRVRGRILWRSVLPLLGPPLLSLREQIAPWRRIPDHYGAFILVKDLTGEREQQQELKVKNAMIREVHHRVKNNLQLLVSIMRMQARRAAAAEAQFLLTEAMNRILSMAAIHESLSLGEDQTLNLREIAQRILGQVQQSSIGPAAHIRLLLGDAADIILPTNRVTACALVLTELLLNAIKHGFAEGEGGRIVVSLYDQGEMVEMRIQDDGQGLPTGFKLEQEASLGLDIVRTLVHDDLKGTFSLHSQPGSGTQAVVRFPKTMSGEGR